MIHATHTHTYTQNKKLPDNFNSFKMLLLGPYKHITSVLRSLNLLPVSYSVDFKILLLVSKSLEGLGLKSISDSLIQYEPPQPLRSSVV